MFGVGDNRILIVAGGEGRVLVSLESVLRECPPALTGLDGHGGEHEGVDVS